MSRPHQLVPCTRLSLAGEIAVDLRYPPTLGSAKGETAIWAEVWQRREPESALFIADQCVWKGAFVSAEAAAVKLKAMRE